MDDACLRSAHLQDDDTSQYMLCVVDRTQANPYMLGTMQSNSPFLALAGRNKNKGKEEFVEDSVAAVYEQDDRDVEALDYTIADVSINTTHGPMNLKTFYACKLYGGYLMREYFPITQFKSDDQGLKSLTPGNDSRQICLMMDQFIGKNTDGTRRQLIITEACAGAGVDSMQFMVAVNPQNERIFSTVNSFEID